MKLRREIDQVRLCPQQLDDDLAIRLDTQRVSHERESYLGVEQFADSKGSGSTDPRRRVAQEQTFDGFHVSPPPEGMEVQSGASNDGIDARGPAGGDCLDDAVVQETRFHDGQDQVGQVEDRATFDSFGESKKIRIHQVRGGCWDGERHERGVDEFAPGIGGEDSGDHGLNQNRVGEASHHVGGVGRPGGPWRLDEVIPESDGASRREHEPLPRRRAERRHGNGDQGRRRVRLNERVEGGFEQAHGVEERRHRGCRSIQHARRPNDGEADARHVEMVNE